MNALKVPPAVSDMRTQQTTVEIPLDQRAGYFVRPGKSKPGALSNAGNVRRAEIDLLVCCARTELNDAAKTRIVEILKHDLDWNEVLDQAAAHAIVPLVCSNLKQYSEAVPLKVLDRLKVLAYQSNIHNLRLASELSRLTSLMEDNGITSLPFKGPVLATEMYGDLARRQFSDLDILIPKKDFQRVKGLFLMNGFVPLVERTLEQEAAYLAARRPYNYKLVSSDRRVLVELHWRFTSKYNSLAVDYDQLFKRLVKVSFAGRKVHHLAPEDLLLLLSQHGSKHFWTRLLWLVDIVEVLRRHPEINWPETVTRAESMGMRRMLFLALYLAERLFDLEFPAEVKKRINKERKVKVLAARIEKRLFCESPPIQNFETHVFSCAMRERLLDKLRYAGYRVLAHVAKAATPTEKDRKTLPAGMSASHLAYLLRPPRLLLEASSNLLRQIRKK